MTVLALLSSDLHCRSLVPTSRAEKDWYGVMLNYFNQIRALQEKHKTKIWIVAGDIFDRYAANPELINFLIDNMPKCHTIPGQHDLPLHVYEDMSKSGYGTLVRAGIITDMRTADNPHRFDRFNVYAFPWNHEITPIREGVGISLAVIHAYIWTKDTGYPNAPVEQKAGAYKEKLKGYRCSVWGDNHKNFLIGNPNEFQILNCGGFIPVKSDERNHKPVVGLLHDDGGITTELLDTSKDEWQIEEKAEPLGFMDNSGFVHSLKTLGLNSLDFREAVDHAMSVECVNEGVRKIVSEILT